MHCWSTSQHLIMGLMKQSKGLSLLPVGILLILTRLVKFTLDGECITVLVPINN